MSDNDPQAPSFVPGMAQVRIDIARLRTLVVVLVVLLLIVVIGLGAWIMSLSSQVSTLSSQMAIASQGATPTAAAAPELAAATEPSAPAGVDAAGAFLIGDPAATDIVEVYVDYQCPFCQRWEQQVGAALVERALQPSSGLLLKQHNLAFLGETSKTLDPPGASARAAAAAACVIDGEGAKAFTDFNAKVFASADPAEPPTQFATSALALWAADLGASPETIACIESERFVPFVAAATARGFGRGVNGTPTVIVNGVATENPFEDAALNALLTGQLAS